MIKKALLATTIAASSFSLPALAHQAGDFIGRAGAAIVLPDVEYSGLGNAGVDLDEPVSVAITLSYMLTDTIAIGGIAAGIPFKAEISGAGDLAAAGKVATVRFLPPALTAQWHFPTAGKAQPYVGLGFNYAIFWDEKTTGALAAADLDLDPSFGLTLEAGVDYDLGNGLMLAAQVFYMDISTETDIEGMGTLELDLDPFAVLVGISKKF